MAGGMRRGKELDGGRDAEREKPLPRQLALDRGRVALTESLYAATENLYGQLEPEQQRTADQWLLQLLTATAVERPAKVWSRDRSR
jgi:hypothetical protein